MLTTPQLEANKTKFIETNEKYNVFTKELEEFLGDAFYTAPASTTLDKYGCYPGGLLNHLIKACKYTIKLNELLPDFLKQDKTEIVRVIFLSQIGKVFMFCPNDNEWERNKLGKMYDFCDIVRLKVGERSLVYSLNHGVKLNERECQAIVNQDKDNDDKMAKYFSEPLTQIIRQGFDLAILEEKENGKK